MGDREELLNDNEAAQRVILDGRQVMIWTALPAIVTSVNFEEMTVEVIPAIQGTIIDENGVQQAVNLPKLVDVPITFPGAGGFTITFPIAVDDECLVIFSSRCIDAWWQSGGIQRPAEIRMHDLSDGFAIFAPKSLPNVIEDISATDCQIRNDGGDAYVSITADGKIKLVSASEVDVNAPLVKVTADEADINAPVVKIAGAATTVTGNLTVTGLITGATLAVGGVGGVTVAAGGALAAPSAAIVGAVTAASVAATTVSAGAIGLSTHKHTGVTTGAGTSGGPTP